MLPPCLDVFKHGILKDGTMVLMHVRQRLHPLRYFPITAFTIFIHDPPMSYSQVCLLQTPFHVSSKTFWEASGDHTQPIHGYSRVWPLTYFMVRIGSIWLTRT